MIGVAFILIFLPDGGLEGFGFLRGPFVCVAVDGGEHRGRLLSPHHADPRIGPGEEETRAIGAATHAVIARAEAAADQHRSEEHTSELQSLMRISYAVFCLKKKKNTHRKIKKNIR